MRVPKNFLWSGIASGVKRSGRLDLGIAYSSYPATVAAVFTENKLAAPPVVEARRRLKKNRKFRGIVANSGVANAATGQRGFELNNRMIASTARLLGLEENEVLSASTGVIGEDLPVDTIEAALPVAVDNLAETVTGFSRAILTTDSGPKLATRKIETLDATLIGVAKGAGMINPSMATMLVFLFLDHPVKADWWQQSLQNASDSTFNRISVDGDMSTNDTLLAMAADIPGKKPVDAGHPAAGELSDALTGVCSELSELIVADGEGATCVMKINVSGALDDAQARLVAEEIAGSTLVKTAFYGCDPNWGRVFSSVGASGAEVDSEKLNLAINGETVFSSGRPLGISERLEETMKQQDQHLIEVDLGLAAGSATRLTCDLSEEYVKINSAYRS
ncbi:MAG: bifunctional glutamate N-acetyltransferase/amino-acid acetyltransferase ArgJ [bacterium]